MPLHLPSADALARQRGISLHAARSLRSRLRREAEARGETIEDCADAPLDGYRLPRTWRAIPRSDTDDPARARWLALSPEQRIQARAEARRRYWAQRCDALEAELRRWERFAADEPECDHFRDRAAQLAEDLELARAALKACEACQ